MQGFQRRIGADGFYAFLIGNAFELGIGHEPIEIAGQFFDTVGSLGYVLHPELHIGAANELPVGYFTSFGSNCCTWSYGCGFLSKCALRCSVAAGIATGHEEE